MNSHSVRNTVYSLRLVVPYDEVLNQEYRLSCTTVLYCYKDIIYVIIIAIMWSLIQHASTWVGLLLLLLLLLLLQVFLLRNYFSVFMCCTCIVPEIYYEILHQRDGGNVALNHICQTPECIWRWHVHGSTAGFKPRVQRNISNLAFSNKPVLNWCAILCQRMWKFLFYPLLG